MARTALLALLLAVGGGGLYLGSLPDLVSALWNVDKAGGSYDPNGAAATADAGGSADPNG